VKLLNVLQEREFQHLGGTKTIKVDVRIIAATNKNLEKSVVEGTFREDLFYRLNVVPITIPSLRERREDIGVLIEHFLHKSALISNRPPKIITKSALDKLINYKWPGNIRELENAIERCVVITSGDDIDIDDLPPLIAGFNSGKEEAVAHYTKLDDVVDTAERDVIIKTLNDCGGNRTKASIMLGISRRSLQRKILKYNIED
jgi:transcriptional regulator with PAS, ATPase and Fis domain